MQNVKSFVGKNLSVESSLSMTAPDDTLNNENVFLIGLNFNGSINNGIGRDNQFIAQNKIPMLMLKIDADKILHSQSLEVKNNPVNNYQVNNDMSEITHQNTNPIREIYSIDYNPSGNNLPHENLSYREMQVMKLIALGKARKEIADELFLSISTINTYRARILEKMNMKNNAEIMRYSFQHKLVE